MSVPFLCSCKITVSHYYAPPRICLCPIPVQLVPFLCSYKMSVSHSCAAVPEITFPPENFAIEEDQFQPVTFTCAAAGIPPPEISWVRQEDGENTPLIEDDTITISDPIETDSFMLPGVMGVVFGVNRSLTLMEAMDEDSGVYLCVVNNTAADASTEFQLLVRGEYLVTS